MPLIIMGLRGFSLIVKFLLTLFIARFMGFDDVGLYGIVTSLTLIIPAVTGLGISYVFTRKAVTQSHRETVEAIYNYGIFMVLIYVLLFLLGLVGGNVTGLTGFVLLCVVLIFFEHITLDFYNLLLNLSKPFAGNILHFIKTAAWMGSYMTLAYFDPSYRTIDALLFAWVMGSVAAFLFGLLSLKNWPWKPFVLHDSLPQWVRSECYDARHFYYNSLVFNVTQYFNHFLILFLLGLELTGVYVYFMQVQSALANLLRTGIVQVTRPKLVKAFKEKSDDFMLIYKKCMLHTFLSSLAMAAVTYPCMYYVTQYIDRPLAIEWFEILSLLLLVFVMAMIAEVNRLIFYAQHRDDIILKLGMIGVIGTVMLNIILVSLFDLWGAALSPVIMCVVALILQRREIRRLI